MKIGLVTGHLAYSPRIRDKQDSQGPKQEQEKKDDGSDSSSQKEKEEQLEYAMAEFRANQDSKANGLTVTMDGEGPGLRVILKDGEGQTVRQLSGEEFLKLRHSLSAGLHLPGKILDQKL